MSTGTLILPPDVGLQRHEGEADAQECKRLGLQREGFGTTGAITVLNTVRRKQHYALTRCDATAAYVVMS